MEIGDNAWAYDAGGSAVEVNITGEENGCWVVDAPTLGSMGKNIVRPKHLFFETPGGAQHAHSVSKILNT